MVEETFRTAVKKFELFKKKETVIVGVSGGPDSVSLLHLLHKHQKQMKLTLVCAHLNHGLRPQADKDERFVVELCQALKIKCITLKKDIQKIFKGDSLEQTARRVRFEFFMMCAKQYKTKKIALAHTKDDIVETVLMRIIRGTALRGLRGILAHSRYQGFTIVRPLAEIEKKELLAYLAEKNIPYRIDHTNYQDIYFRNKIRNTLLPQLFKYNPNIQTALFNLAQISATDYDYLQSVCKKELDSIKCTRRGSIRLKLKRLQELHPALITGVLRLAIEELKGNLRRLEYRHFQEVINLILSRPPGSLVSLPDIEVVKEKETLIIKSLIL